MRDFCSEACANCAAYLERLSLSDPAGRLCVQNSDCEIALALHEDDSPLLPPIEHRWFDAAVQRGNRLCFILSDAFYRDAAAHILQEPLPPPDEDAREPLAYARMRMRMLARKRGNAFPADARRALWRAMSAHMQGVSQGLCQSRLKEAAALSLALGGNIPLRERQSYRNGCALAAACLARLLISQ